MSYNKDIGMYEGYIYCIKNLINDKMYIGYTKNDINTRWNQHLSKTHHKEDNSILHTAINKYNKENFSISIIETVTSSNLENLIEILKDREIYHIKDKDTISPRGYNILHGGGNTPINRIQPVYQYTLDGLFIAKYNSITEAIQITGVDDNPRNSKIGKCLKTNHFAFDYLWNTNNDEDVVHLYKTYMINKYGTTNVVKNKKNKIPSRKKKKEVYQYNLNGEFLCKYDSINQASEVTGLSRIAISKILNGHVKTIPNHFIFNFEYLSPELIVDRYMK